MAFKSIYPKPDVVVGTASAVTQNGRVADSPVAVRPPLPGSFILVHGVNDVGVSYSAVERGLCAGLGDRLDRPGQYQPATYRLPRVDDKGRLEVDPDAVFFKRQADAATYSPVIPFYWGYREKSDRAVPGSQTPHGQDVDRYGNRLDKDASKGGGPFGNATSTLVDMWNRGFGVDPLGRMDWVKKDPLRPLLDAPGRMYMVLAAQRLAALVSMIRDYDPNETVSIVGHSQGCMLTLLAQAFLMERGLRPADTLVLTHPPYSLVDEVTKRSGLAELLSGGTDAAMEDHYGVIQGRQTMDARLRTLAAIVEGVAAKKQTTPAIHTLRGPEGRGVVGAKWVADAPERDNRGKVYLYFCPEDTTVALENVQGIGWQGVPDFITGTRLTPVQDRAFGATRETWQPETEQREARKELGAGFFQRVFTGRARRSENGQGRPQPVLVGAQPPCDFALLTMGEDDHAHVTAGSANFSVSPPEVDWPAKPDWLSFVPKPEAAQRRGIRSITGERLRTPVVADMSAGAMDLGEGKRDGRHEEVDPIDAAISVTSRYGLQDTWQLIDDRTPPMKVAVSGLLPSPAPAIYPGHVNPADDLKTQVDAEINAGLDHASQRRVLAVFRCLDVDNSSSGPTSRRRLLVRCKESADEARLRQQQHGRSDRSFHGAIFGSAENHRQVTAYDVAIGQGYAPSRKQFNEYLCAVADWRLVQAEKSGNDASGQNGVRAGILRWGKFLNDFASFYATEPAWRQGLIEGNSRYYSTGKLSQCLPVLPDGLPRSVVSETMSGKRIVGAGSETVASEAPVHLR